MTTDEPSQPPISMPLALLTDEYTAVCRAMSTVPDPTPQPSTGSAWVSQPPHSDQAIQDATGRSWDQWVEVIDAGPGRDATHTTIAAWVHANSSIGHWWSQSVTVGYERITGKRLPGQMPDGTFTLAQSRTLPIDPDGLRQLLDDERSLTALMPNMIATRKSKPGVKAPRYHLTDLALDLEEGQGPDMGVLQLMFDASGAKTKFTVTHEKLPNPGALDAWREYWSRWLDIVEDQIVPNA